MYNKWSKLTTKNAPKVRYSHAIGTTGKYLVLHGGYNLENGFPLWLDDLWVLSKLEWSQVKVSTERPIARYSHTLINLHDIPSTQGTFYLFGGDDGGYREQQLQHLHQGYMFGHYFNDLWKLTTHLVDDTYVEGVWTQLSLPKDNILPTPRTSHTAIAIQDCPNSMDSSFFPVPVDVCMVLFGGLTTKKTVKPGKLELIDSNELWIMTPSPTNQDTVVWKLHTSKSKTIISSRHGHSATTDETGKTMYIYGGQTHAAKSLLSDLWSWSVMHSWTKLHDGTIGKSKSLSSPFPNGLVYSSLSIKNNFLILFGGAHGCNSRCFTESKTWLWSIETQVWQLVSGVDDIHPPHRYRHSLTNILDQQGESVAVLFGGESYGVTKKYHNDVWMFTNTEKKSKSHDDYFIWSFLMIVCIIVCSFVIKKSENMKSIQAMIQKSKRKKPEMEMV